MDPANPALPIHDMSARHQGLTQETAASYLQAARVCLDRHHESPTLFGVDAPSGHMDALVQWEKTDERIRGAWANDDDATSDGAYACALAALELTESLVALRRAETRTGADYYVGPPGTSLEDLEEALRFEVSGVDRGAPSVVRERLKAKLDQAIRGESNLPAMAGVVGFRVQLAVLAHMAVANDVD